MEKMVSEVKDKRNSPSFCECFYISDLRWELAITELRGERREERTDCRELLTTRIVEKTLAIGVVIYIIGPSKSVPRNTAPS